MEGPCLRLHLSLFEHEFFHDLLSIVFAAGIAGLVGHLLDLPYLVEAITVLSFVITLVLYFVTIRAYCCPCPVSTSEIIV